MCNILEKTPFLYSYPRFRFAIPLSTACSFAMHNLNWFINVPISKFHFIWHTKQTTEKSKMLFVNKLICNFILQVIRNFMVEYNYEMKYKHTLLRAPASPLKFRMTDRVGWRSPINLWSLIMSEFEHIIWLERFACNTKIKISVISCNKFTEN